MRKARRPTLATKKPLNKIIRDMPPPGLDPKIELRNNVNPLSGDAKAGSKILSAIGPATAIEIGAVI